MMSVINVMLFGLTLGSLLGLLVLLFIGGLLWVILDNLK